MADATDELESMYAALRNLNDMEQQEFRNVAVFRPTLRERYLTINYHRAAFNVEMMVATKDTKQFQTIALLARTIFELAVEMKLIYQDKDAARKIELFSRVELLKSARRLVEFKTTHPDAQFHYETHEQFIDTQGRQIDAEKDVMWPDPPGQRRTQVKHWTRKSLRHRQAIWVRHSTGFTIFTMRN